MLIKFPKQRHVPQLLLLIYFLPEWMNCKTREMRNTLLRFGYVLNEFISRRAEIHTVSFGVYLFTWQRDFCVFRAYKVCLWDTDGIKAAMESDESHLTQKYPTTYHFAVCPSWLGLKTPHTNECMLTGLHRVAWMRRLGCCLLGQHRLPATC